MTVASNAARPARADSVFFPLMSLLMGLTAFAGFWQTFYLRPLTHSTKLLTPVLAAHGTTFTLWVLLMIVQTGLIAGGRRDVHRKLGWFGAGLAVTMFVVGLAAGIETMRRGFTLPGSPLSPASFFVVPVGAMAAFLPLVILGVVNRKRLDYHKRYMLLSTLAILTAAIARIPSLEAPTTFFALTDLFIVAVVGYDLAMRGRVHRATLISTAILVGSQVGRLVIGPTLWWQAFANSLI
jgi:hypothetical protein